MCKILELLNFSSWWSSGHVRLITNRYWSMCRKNNQTNVTTEICQGKKAHVQSASLVISLLKHLIELSHHYQLLQSSLWLGKLYDMLRDWQPLNWRGMSHLTHNKSESFCVFFAPRHMLNIVNRAEDFNKDPVAFSHICENRRIWKDWTKERNILSGCHRHLQREENGRWTRSCKLLPWRTTEVWRFFAHLVGRFLCVVFGPNPPNYQETVQEVRLDHIWQKGGLALLVDHRYNVIPNVSFPLELCN